MRTCFTGHRPDKLEAAGQIPLEQVSASLRDSIVSAVDDGITTFISGMCPGIDILAAEEVIKLRATDSRIKLIAAMPYPRFAFNWENWGIRVESVLARADLVKYVSPTYTGKGVFRKRNQWMIDHSDRLIAYWDGSPGGTYMTVTMARNKGIKIDNCFEKKTVTRFREEYEFLSNFSPSPIVLGGVQYFCAESAFQAIKLENKADRKMFSGINGRDARILGRNVHLRSDWEQIKLDVMRWVIRAKFEQNPKLKAKLMATKGMILQEGNGWGDTFWGMTEGVGQNWLGRIIMEYRDNNK